MEAKVFAPGEGLRRTARGNDMFFKATGSMTAGRFSLMERTVPAGAPAPPAHRHVANDEAFYVLAGEIEFRLDDQVVNGGPGTLVLVPGGVAHTFANTAADESRLLVLHSPALDEYFAELERLWSRHEPPNRDEELHLMRRHGMDPA